MTKLAIPLIFLLFSLPLFAQPMQIEGIVKEMKAGKVYLTRIRGDEQLKVDSLLVSGEIFRFNLKDPVPGLYRVNLGKPAGASFYNEKQLYFDIIIHQENSIKVSTNYYAPMDSMIVLISDENKIFYRFLSLSALFKNKGSSLLPLFSLYNHRDPFFDALQTEFARFQEDYNEKLVSLAEEAPESFASSYITMNLVPQVDPSIGYDAMNDFLKNHFFDFVLFNDPRLINSRVYVQRVLEYLGFYRKPSLTQSDQEDQFIKAVDRIMERASYNEQVFEFILGFLIDGFDQFKMEKVLVHLAVNYVEKGCETDNKKIMEQRLESFKRMATGNVVNDIVLLDLNGKTRRLSDLNNQYVLIVFWSTSCHHCTRLLPDLKEWYLENPGLDFEVFSVSIDTSRIDWETNILMNDYPWIDVCNLQGWEGKAASDYNIYATPTMFIIDREKKIKAKPLTFRDFKRDFEKLTAK